METPPKIEANFVSPEESGVEKEKPPILETAKLELAEMDQEMGEFLSELEIAEKNTDDEKLRKQIKELKNEAMWTADWWAGNIYAFTELVVGEGINFSAIEQIKESQKQETFEEIRERAKKELEENGITSEQRKTYKPVVNDFLAKGIEPYSYDDGVLDKILAMPDHLFGLSPGIESDKTRYDAWRFYLGKPQKNNTFGLSNYRPAKEQEMKESSSQEYFYSINGFWDSYFDKEKPQEKIKELVKEIKGIDGSGRMIVAHDRYKTIMGAFSFRLSEDEKGSYIAYDDIWDIAAFPENQKGFFGKPFHIYDRLYYDPETYDPIYE